MTPPTLTLESARAQLRRLGFYGLLANEQQAFFVPPAMKAAITPTRDDYDDRQSRWLQIVGRLDATAAAAAWADMEERLAVFTTATGWEGPNELLLTAGRR